MNRRIENRSLLISGGTLIIMLAVIFGLLTAYGAALTDTQTGSDAVNITQAEDSLQSEHGKQLVISVIDEEDLFEIEDSDVPLGLFSTEGNRQEGSGRRHIILMAAMLAGVIFLVIYQGRNEKKLIALRRKAARAQYSAMEKVRDANRSQA